MDSLKRLALALSLAIALAGTTFAGETSSPPCSPNPGETSSPPCVSSAITSGDQGDLNSQMEKIAVDATISAIENILAVF
jgi:hypothetical protein